MLLRITKIIAIVMLMTSLAVAQGGVSTEIRFGSSLPTSAKFGSLFNKTGTNAGLYKCNASPCTVDGDWNLIDPKRFGVPFGSESIPSASQVLQRLPIPGGITWSIATNCTNTTFQAETAATAQTVISFQKCTGSGYTSCSEFGTCTVAAAGKTCTLSCSATSFTGGTDSVMIVAPASADATLSKLSGVLMGTR